MVHWSKTIHANREARARAEGMDANMNSDFPESCMRLLQEGWHSHPLTSESPIPRFIYVPVCEYIHVTVSLEANSDHLGL